MVQGPAYPTNSAAFSTKSDEAKILSYMWYIHVTVRVNAADRLWDRLVQLLGQGTATAPTTPAATPTSPPYSPQFDLDGLNSTGSRSEYGQRSTPDREGNSTGAANKIDDLTDYFVLQFFSRPMLETLVNTAPIEEHTDGYARVLAGVPVHFRQEFCRRLYCLLFSKYILEWPQGIAVPEPAPGSIAAAAAATTESSAAASSTRLEATAASTSSNTAADEGKRKKEEDDEKDEFMFDMDDILTYGENDDIFDGENYERLVSPEPATSPGYQSTLGPSSPWPDTPSLGYSPELSRAAYFGTVSAPLPIQYLGNCGRSISSSSRDDGLARAAYAGSAAGGGGAGAVAGAGASHDERLPPSTSWHRRHPAAPAPPHHTTTSTTTPQQEEEERPASLLGSAHSRERVSHTGSCCCPCRVREAWSHGVGGQR